jgi:anion-transporting  ArsA/GET3 family ATPase
MDSKSDHRLQGQKKAPTRTLSKSQELSDNEIFHLLATKRRREAIRYLLKTGTQIQLSKLARHVAAAEHELSVNDVTQAQYQRVYITLYQSHLPKLDEAGVIRFDSTRGVVEPTEQLDVFARYLRIPPSQVNSARSSSGTVASDKQKVSNWYFASAGLSGILLLVVTLGVISITGELLGGLIIVLFLIANIATRWQHRT